MKSQLKPRYQHIKDLIIEQISKGDLRPHDRVPSENELVESTGVSRMTANRALRELTDEGYVDRVAGIGTFVSDLKANSHVLEVRNIADEVTHRGHAHSAHIIQRRRRPADEEIAQALNIPDGTEVFNILLVHHEDGTPIQVEDRYVKTEFAPEFLEQDFTTITPSAYLSNISPLQEADHVVRAVMPDQTVQEYLKMAVREPCLVVIRRTWANGRPVTYGRLHHPGSRYELTGHYAKPGTPQKRQLEIQRNGVNKL
jgi:GntR family histidine utilization transcriptional repressor